MDKIDATLRQELLKHGYQIQSSSCAAVIRTLLRDIDRYQEQAADADKLFRQNVEFSQNAVHYKLQLAEKEVELTSIKRAAAEEKQAYDERIEFFEKQIDGLPRSSVLQQIWGTEISKEHFNMLHYADRQLHELQNTNRQLMRDLDKQFLQTGVFLTKIKTRDIEIQRLTELINTGKVKYVGSRTDDASNGSSSSGGFQLKLLKERNAELERTVERLRASQKSAGVKSTVPELDLRRQLELAEAARKELAVNVDCLNSKCTSLQGVITRYKHEINMLRMEKEDYLRQLQEYQKESIAASTMTDDFQQHHRSRDTVRHPSARARGRTGSLDENGNEADCRTKEVPNNKENRQKDSGGHLRSRTDSREGVSDESGEEFSNERLLEKLSEYESKFSRLSENLRMFRDAITKKDVEIANLRSQVALISRSQEENGRLRKELAHLGAKSREFKTEIYKLRLQVRSYTSEAARAAELAASTSSEHHRGPAEAAAAATVARSSSRGTDTPPSQPPTLESAVDKPTTSGSTGPRLPGTHVAFSSVSSGTTSATVQRDHPAGFPGTADLGSGCENAALRDELALLRQDVAEYKARASLEEEKRMQAERRLQQFEQHQREESLRQAQQRQHQQQQQPQQQPGEQPPKKFKGTIRIEHINGEIELSPNTV